MAHPKRRSSTSRRDKRRGGHSNEVPTLVKCPTTGLLHMPHVAFWHNDKLYYRGQVIMDKHKS